MKFATGVLPATFGLAWDTLQGNLMLRPTGHPDKTKLPLNGCPENITVMCTRTIAIHTGN